MTAISMVFILFLPNVDHLATRYWERHATKGLRVGITGIILTQSELQVVQPRFVRPVSFGMSEEV